MRNILLATTVAAMIPTMALAEGPYLGAQIGYHDIDVDVEEGDEDGNINGIIYGLYAGYDIALQGPWSLGAEVNFNLGTDEIDADYGVSARVGFNVSETAMVFLRGGYQEVNLDAQNVLEDELGRDLTSTEEDDLDGLDLDDDDGGWLLGVGTEFALQENLALRVAVDTIEFDSARVTAGISFRF